LIFSTPAGTELVGALKVKTPAAGELSIVTSRVELALSPAAFRAVTRIGMLTPSIRVVLVRARVVKRYSPPPKLWKLKD
jgi:hypothetical protein